jgi:predicted Holliday junction resolvase-like endonuclease
MESRVFWGVLCALLVFSGLVVIVIAFGIFSVGVAVKQEQSRQQEQVVAQMQAVQGETREALVASALAAERQRVAQRDEIERRREEMERRRLGPDHRCVAGTVFEVKQWSAVQLPARCAGDYADRPLR